MKTYLKKHQSWVYAGISVIGLFVLLIATFTFRQPGERSKNRTRDYAEIVASDTIRATTEYNSISYFVEGDTMAGFNYELLQAFSRDHHLKADIHPQMAFDKCLEGLAQGRYDIIANGILGTSELKDSLLLTVPIALSRQVLVQRKPVSEQDTMYIESLLDLSGKTVHVVKDSPCILRIRNIEDEIGDTIYIKEIEKYGAEQLISLVAYGDIDYAVCEENIAEIVADSIPQIDISTAISFTQFYCWAVSKNSPVLLDTLNTWIEQFKKGKEYKKIYRKYYK